MTVAIWTVVLMTVGVVTVVMVYWHGYWSCVDYWCDDYWRGYSAVTYPGECCVHLTRVSFSPVMLQVSMEAGPVYLYSAPDRDAVAEQI